MNYTTQFLSRLINTFQNVLVESNSNPQLQDHSGNRAHTLFWRFILSNFLGQYDSKTRQPYNAMIGLEKETPLGKLLDLTLPLQTLVRDRSTLLESTMRKASEAFTWELVQTSPSSGNGQLLTPESLASILESRTDTSLGVAVTPTWLASYIAAHCIKSCIESKMMHKLKLDWSSENNEARLKVPNDVCDSDIDSLNREALRLRILDISVGYGAFYLACIKCLTELLYDIATRLRTCKETYSLKDSRMKCFTVACKNVYGIDINSLSVSICKSQLALLVAREMLKTSGSVDIMNLSRYVAHARLFVGNTIIGELKPAHGLEPYLTAETVATKPHSEAYTVRGISPGFLATVSPFSWSSETPEVVEGGGFDIVVGNPPYIGYRYINKQTKLALSLLYPDVSSGTADMQTYFISRALELTRSGGHIALLISRYFLEAKYGKKMRRQIDSEAFLSGIIDLREAKFFAGKSNNVAIMFITKKKQSDRTIRTRVSVLRDTLKRKNLSLSDLIMLESNTVSQLLFESFIATRPKGTWQFMNSQTRVLFERVGKVGVPLADLCFIGTGYHTGNDKIFSSNIIDSDKGFFGLIQNHDRTAQIQLEPELIRPIIKTTDILPFAIDWQSKFLLYMWNLAEISKYPGALQYLSHYRAELEKRYEVQARGGKWYELARVRNPHIFVSDKKIVCPYRAPYLRFALDEKKRLHSIDCTSIVPKPGKEIDFFYILGILNSWLIDFVFRITAKRLDAKKLELYPVPLSRIPVKLPKSSREEKMACRISELSKELYTDIASTMVPRRRIASILVDARRSLIGPLSSVESDQHILEDYWKKVREIDSLTFDIYGLQENEKTIIRGSLETVNSIA